VIVIHTYNPSSRDAEAVGSQFKTNLGYILKPYVKINKQANKYKNLYSEGCIGFTSLTKRGPWYKKEKKAAPPENDDDPRWKTPGPQNDL
jgi:hypothetical protein